VRSAKIIVLRHLWGKYKKEGWTSEARQTGDNLHIWPHIKNKSIMIVSRTHWKYLWLWAIRQQTNWNYYTLW